jgi:hypothetical protein
LFGLFLPQAHAADKQWVGKDGDAWNDGTKWRPKGQPKAGDTVKLTQEGQADQTVTYKSDINPTLKSLLINGTRAGRMTLSQSMDSLTTDEERIGSGGKGAVIQSGGTHVVNLDLAIGEQSGDGSFTLSNNAVLKVQGSTIIGNDAVGVFNQSGGTFTVLGDTVVSRRGDGSYIQSGGIRTVNGSTIVGDGDVGTYTQTGGTHTVKGSTILGANGGTGTYSQSGGTHTTGGLSIGVNSVKGEYKLSGGELTVGNQELIGPTGAFSQTGGKHTVTTGGLILRGGSFTLGGGDLKVTGSETIGLSSNGLFTQTGGMHRVEGEIVLGNGALGSEGRYELKGGDLTVTGNERIGRSGASFFTQTGGTHTVEGSLLLGPDDNSGSKGTYTLKGGELKVGKDEVIGAKGEGTFTQTGGTHTVTNSLAIGAKNAGTGTFNLSAGTLKASTITITNNGTFNYSGGSITGNLTNAGNMKISGGGQRVIDGQVTNTGTWKVTGTSVTYTKGFMDSGKYTSDPATNVFTDLTVAKSGYLTGGAGDKFIIGGNFANQSQQSSLWSTEQSTLAFAGAGVHSLGLVGVDVGARLDGYTNNFAWGAFSLDSAAILNVSDGGTGPEAALYTGVFNLAGHDLGQLMNIHSNDNFYYLDWLPGNAYLDSKRYALGGQGFLIPISVPEPSSLILMGIGLLSLGTWVARSRRRVHLAGCSSSRHWRPLDCSSTVPKPSSGSTA